MDKLEEFSLNGPKNTDGLTLLSGFPSNQKPARQWFNWLFNSLTKKINEIIDAIQNNSDAEIGKVSMWFGEVPPLKHVEIAGQTLNKADFPKLFAKYGIAAETWTLPDTRAEFPRGWDNGRGVDASRTIGSMQEDSIKAHDHTYWSWNDNTGDDSESIGNYDPNGGGRERSKVKTSSVGSTETRPRNFATMFIMRVS
ncbi:phage tail protein [Acinetobacter baumannii]|uniref:tail fiber protein n=1 Tax=Acinetobacter calcoaceticus/baumannii complex TaxID=909768 RepID=UPI0010CB9D76|nr:phage tail protein [Acinetobacter pittii]MDC5119503.1 phage tail protein [Acinetobacter baumannii]MCE6629421.1 phage tail protein [Acinetobacter pittii]TKV65968.1 TetR family transcriptional regulator [Acinetobacter baumannii]TKV70058.1 TetR family transcriptional regulator [Acinetobacter baumannii]